MSTIVGVVRNSLAFAKFTALLRVRIENRCKEPATLTQQADSAGARSNKEKCDFSAYQYVREWYFIKRAALKKVKPTYPAEAVRLGIQGQVQVEVLINRDGNVERACAKDSDDLLKHAAEEAALQWKFKPYFGAAKAVDAGTRKYVIDIIPFNFVLDKADKTVPEKATTVRP